MELQEFLKNKTAEAVWDIISDYKFFNFPLLLSLVEKQAVQVEPDQIKLIQLMANHGYKEFLKTDIKLPRSKQHDIIQKLIILDFLDLTETCQGQMDFDTLREITHSKSIEALIEFLILVLTIGVLKGKINTQKKILVIFDVIPRNYGNLQDLGSKIQAFSAKVQESIDMLSAQIENIDSKQEEWKKEEEGYQAQLKKVSDKVKRLYRSK